jgi:hypothetical protein
MKRIVGCYCIIGKDYTCGISLQNAIMRCGAVRNNIDCNDLETILVDFQIQNIKPHLNCYLVFRIAHWQLLHLIFYYMFLAIDTDIY